MGVKTITVREEAYKLLLEMKKEKESFSDVLVRVLRKKTARKSRVMDFFGVLKESKNLEEMEKEILEQRKKSEMRDVFT
ncbi:MAG: antitoxin VapB family protein [Euryarchaeota archaeon]|nr:antitoxin VapB family protein [Euryarchaeota archaeon]